MNTTLAQFQHVGNVWMRYFYDTTIYHRRRCRRLRPCRPFYHPKLFDYMKLDITRAKEKKGLMPIK